MAIIFTGDFETGNTSQFTSASGSVQSSVVKTGTYSGLNTNNTNFIKTLSAAYTTVYVHGYFRWNVDPATASVWYVILGYGDVSASSQFAVTVDTGKLRVSIPDISGTTYIGTTTLSANTWYEIEIRFIMDDTNGSFDLRLNGTTEVSASSIDTKSGTDTGIKSIRWQGINAAGNCYVDDCSVDTTTWYRQKYSLRVSLAGYNALTEANIDNYSLFADTDNVLIKEKVRGTSSVSRRSVGTIAHGLSYVPFFMVYVQVGTDRYWLYGYNIYSKYNTYADTTNIYLRNDSNSSCTFLYYIFYDQQV